MKGTKRIIIAILLLALTVLNFTGCRAKAVEVVIDIPTTTSEELNLYYMGDEVYNEDGIVQEDFSLDDDGNIINAEGEIVVAAINAKEFSCIEDIEIEDQATLSQKIEAEEMEDGTVTTKPVEFTLTFNVGSQYVNKAVTLESYDPGALYFPYDKNKNVIAGSDQAPSDNVMPSITVKANDKGEIPVVMVGSFDGEYSITAKNVLGAQIGTFTTKLIPEYTDKTDDDDKDEDDSKECKHEYTERIVSPTVNAQGYTIYTCSKCGNTYRDNYTAKLACTHKYVDKVIAPTYTANGYTLHTCSICGNVKKDTETAKLVCKHETTKDTVVSPTCTSSGYTLHECTTCKNYSYRDTEVSALGHNYTEKVVPSTCSTSGYTTHTCSRCGDSYRDRETGTTAHNYVDTVVAATTTSQGYTEHKCSACGYSYVDSYTDKLPHEHNYVPTGESGEPDCVSVGYVDYKCSVCGQPYSEITSQALGHDWAAHTESKVVGSEVHTICGTCGMDLTANGISGNDITDHVKPHALAGEGSRTYSTTVAITQDVTTYVCTRCGVTSDTPY
jgi:hypothetical protein